MSREEAIKLLGMLHGMIEDNLGSDYDTAFKMAIADMEKMIEIERIEADDGK